MTGIQVNLDEEEDRILDTFYFISGEKTKKLALKKLIKKFKDLDPSIKEALKIQNNQK